MQHANFGFPYASKEHRLMYAQNTSNSHAKDKLQLQLHTKSKIMILKMQHDNIVIKNRLCITFIDQYQ